MSDKPKPSPVPNGQVASLTQHRAEKSGQFVPTVYDTPYRKGERINCDDPTIAYIVSIGKVRVKKQMDTQTGPNLVTVDFLDKGMPLHVSRFIAGVRDDPELQFFADTDVIIGEFPVTALEHLLDEHQILVACSRNIHGLRKALFGQLERNQKKLEELDEEKRQTEIAARKVDDLADENLGMQMDLGEAQQTAQAALTEVERVTRQRDEFEKQLASSQRKQETLLRSNEALRQSQVAMRESHEEEIARIAGLSEERYAELRERRGLDKERERRRWKAIESLLARLGNPPLLPSEIKDIVDAGSETDEDLPVAAFPMIDPTDIEQALEFCRPTTGTAIPVDEAGTDDSDYEMVDPDEGHTPTLIPPNIEESMAAPPTSPLPVACPASTTVLIKESNTGPRAPMPTLGLGCEEIGRPAITATLQRLPARKPDPPPLPQAQSVGVRTSVMASMPMPPRPSPVSDPKIETRYSSADGRWSWPDDEPLFPSEEPASRPINCPTATAVPFDESNFGPSSTETWDLSDLDKPKPKKK